MISEVIVKKNLRRYFLGTIKWINRIWSLYRYCINFIYVQGKDFLKVDGMLVKCRDGQLGITNKYGLVGRVFANGPGDLGSIPGRVIPKTLKMVLDNLLANTQQYKVRIKGKVEQSRESSSALPYISVS